MSDPGQGKASNNISNKADVNNTDSNIQSPLNEAENKEIDEILIQDEADVNSMDSSKLYWAAYNGNVEDVKQLLRRSASVKYKYINDNDTPLHVAKNKEVAEILIENGADIYCRDSNNRTPLHVAKNREVAKFLIKNGIDVNSRDSNKLFWTAHNGNVENVRSSIASGASVYYEYRLNNQTPLHVTKINEVAQILIQNGANVNSKDSNVSMHKVVDNIGLKASLFKKKICIFVISENVRDDSEVQG